MKPLSLQAVQLRINFLNLIFSIYKFIGSLSKSSLVVINLYSIRNFSIKFLAPFLLLTFSCSKSSAATSLLDDVNSEELPVVLSASRLKSSVVNTPAAVTIIDARLIEEAGVRSLVDVFRLVPGMQVGRFTNGDPIVAYNGQAWRYNPRLQVLIDGRPTYVPLYGGVPWSELPLLVSDIERVEIIRGPNAATYGPNSFSGVVSIITRSPSVNSQGYLNFNLGGNSFKSTSVSYRGKTEDNIYRISAQWDNDSGFENIEDSEESGTLALNGEYEVNHTNSILYAAGFTIGSHIEVDRIGGNILSPTERGTNSFFQFVWENSESSDRQSRLQFYQNNYSIDSVTEYNFDATDFSDDPNLEGETLNYILDKDSLSVRQEIEYQSTFRLNKSQRLSLGAALRRDLVRGRYLFGDDTSRTMRTARIFGHSDFQFGENYTLNIGALAEYNSTFGFTYAPRISLNYAINTQNYLRASYSRGVRSPLLLEEQGSVEFFGQYSNGQEFRDIFIYDELTMKPEIADVYELAYVHNNPKSKLYFDGKFSYQKVFDMIDLEVNREFTLDEYDGRARFFRNVHSYSLSNLEFSLNYKHTRSSSLRFGYSRRLLLLNPQQRLSPPKNTLSVFGSKRFSNGITLSAEYYYTSDWLWNDAPNTDFAKLDRLDFRIAKDFKFGNLDGEFSIQGELELGENTDYLSRNNVSDWYFAGIKLNLP